MAKIEIKKLYETLPDKHIIDIQHVGSTAIPGILSKPINDIQIAVDHLSAIKQIAIDKLKILDYVYWDDNTDKELMFFVKGVCRRLVKNALIIYILLRQVRGIGMVKLISEIIYYFILK